mgnify:CR=1 FL=1
MNLCKKKASDLIEKLKKDNTHLPTDEFITRHKGLFENSFRHIPIDVVNPPRIYKEP